MNSINMRSVEPSRSLASVLVTTFAMHATFPNVDLYHKTDL
jgi:hypothetical protein